LSLLLFAAAQVARKTDDLYMMGVSDQNLSYLDGGAWPPPFAP